MAPEIDKVRGDIGKVVFVKGWHIRVPDLPQISWLLPLVANVSDDAGYLIVTHIFERVAVATAEAKRVKGQWQLLGFGLGFQLWIAQMIGLSDVVPHQKIRNGHLVLWLLGE